MRTPAKIHARTTHPMQRTSCTHTQHTDFERLKIEFTVPTAESSWFIEYMSCLDGKTKSIHSILYRIYNNIACSYYTGAPAYGVTCGQGSIPSRPFKCIIPPSVAG